MSVTSIPPTTTTTAASGCGSGITNSSMMVSEEERREYLDHLQADTTITMIPSMTFLTLLGVTGLFGNSLVIFVYSQRFSMTATKVLIMAIAAFDLVANVVVVPTNIYDMFHMWDFNNPDLCRLRKFTNSFTTLSSAMILVAVAVERYRKICKPYGWQVTVRHAKFISIAVTVLGILFSLPYTVINGRETKETPRPSICGTACDIDDKFVHTSWPLAVNGLYLLLLIAYWTPLIILYIKIGLMAWRHNKEFRTPEIPMTKKKKGGNILSLPKLKTKSSRKLSVQSAGSTGNSKLTESFECSSDGECAAYSKTETPSTSETIEESDEPSVRIIDDRVEIKTSEAHELIGHITEAIQSDPASQNTIASIRQDGKEGDRRNMHAHFKNDFRITGEDKYKVSNDNCEEDEDKMDERQLYEFNHNACADSPLRHQTVDDFQHGHDTNTETKSLQVTNPTVDVTNQAESETDLIRSVKWIDIIYDSKDGMGKDDGSQTPVKTNHTPTKSFSIRLSSSNNILEKAECLRKMILEALEKEQAKRPTSKAKKIHTDANIQMPRRNSVVQRDDTQTSPETGVEPHEEDNGTSEGNGQIHNDRTSNDLKQVAAENKSSRRTSIKGGARRNTISRTTTMLIIISAVFLIGFVPYLVVIFFTYAAPAKFKALTMVELAFYHLFLRFYLLNSAANPIVYSLCNINFRRECWNLLKCQSRRRR